MWPRAGSSWSRVTKLTVRPLAITDSVFPCPTVSPASSWKRLKPLVARSAWLQASGLELLRDVVGRDLEFGRSVSSPLQLVGGKKLDVLEDGVRRDRRWSGEQHAARHSDQERKDWRTRDVAKARSHQDRSYPRAFSTWTRSRVCQRRHSDVSTMPCVDSSAGRTPTLPRAPNSPPSTVRTLKVLRDVVTSASADSCRSQPKCVRTRRPQMRHTSLDARELNLRQHALERMTTDRRLAPGDDEPARRCTEQRESDLRRRALRFERHHRLHGTATMPRARNRSDARVGCALRALPSSSRLACDGPAKTSGDRRGTARDDSSSASPSSPCHSLDVRPLRSAMTQTAAPTTRERSALPSRCV